MKGLTKWIIIAFSLVFCIQGVSAFYVSSISIDPSGSLTPGQQVLVSFKIDFTGDGGSTFPAGGELDLSTDLDKPKWTWTLLLDGVENPRPTETGRMLALSGFELSYPSKVEESVRITLEGTAPSVTQSTNKTIIKIQESDSNGNALTSSEIEKTTMVINTAEVSKSIDDQNGILEGYRSHIDEKAALGIDTIAAEAKYTEAKGKIDAARALPSTQYTQAYDDLKAAQTAIDDGEKALDRAWAENEVTNAQIPIDNVDKVIAWFKGNQSTASNSELPTIITKREVAVSYISTANDDISNGNYEQARSKAQDAFAKGNESYTDALTLQKKVMSGFDLFGMIGGVFKSGILVIVVGVVVAVLVVVGLIIYRKRSRWDELG
jgi:hypothetical protein